MSVLLTVAEFARARDEARAGRVTDELYRWLGKLVALAQASKTLAPAAVPGGHWDDPDAVAETVHAWLEESLLRGGLLQAFDSCETPRALSRYLERSLRNWLIARSRSRTGPRLLDRAAATLEEPPFTVVQPSASIMERWWGLAAWEHPELYAGDDQSAVAAAWALGDFELMRYPSSERSDPVLSSPELRRFLAELLGRVGTALNGRHLDQIFRYRFAYAYATPAIGLDEAPQIADNTSPQTAVEVEEAALVALGAMTERQVRVLLDRPKGTLEEMADALGVSRGTADNEYRRALIRVREATSNDESFAAVLEKVLLLASEGSER